MRNSDRASCNHLIHDDDDNFRERARERGKTLWLFFISAFIKISWLPHIWFHLNSLTLFPANKEVNYYHRRQTIMAWIKRKKDEINWGGEKWLSATISFVIAASPRFLPFKSNLLSIYSWTQSYACVCNIGAFTHSEVVKLMQWMWLEICMRQHIDLAAS